MELNKTNIKKLVGIVSFSILLYWGLQNMEQLFGGIAKLIGVLSPILMGIAIAFIINVPMGGIENTLLKKAGKFKRPLSLVLAIVLVITTILIVGIIVIPEIANTINLIRESIPHFIVNVQVWINEIFERFPDLGAQVSEIVDWSKISRDMLAVAQKSVAVLAGSTFSIVSSTFSGVFSFVLGFVLAMYILLQKEKLSVQFKKMIYAFIQERRADECIRIFAITNKAFKSFFTGQCLEAVILGVMFFIVLSLFKMPYALMISVTIGVAALVPIVGAFLGCFIGAFLILVTAPMKVIVFIIIFLVLQQIEGNFIYPRVVGSSVGLPGIWVLIAVTIGGNTMGIFGMIIMVPLCSVAYTLLREITDKRLKDRKINKGKIA